MSKNSTRKSFMDSVGATMHNPRNSWAGVNHDTKQVFVTTWTDFQQDDGSYLILDEEWQSTTGGRLPGHRNMQELLLKVAQEDYQLCCLFVRAKDINAHPRVMGMVLGNFYQTATLSGIDDQMFATPLKRVEIKDHKKEQRS